CDSPAPGDPLHGVLPAVHVADGSRDVPDVPEADRPGPGAARGSSPLARRLRGFFLAAVVPATRPRREEKEDSRPAVAGDGTPLVGLEREERPRWRLERLAAGLDPHAAVDDKHEG